ncbi:hypothetical protein DSC45_22955 [Streptomyces sp. YIM 130001]|uniref:hypothetical protein n=1 Tax=Streptomyces sp. YIM 130001 TaxID=2259644 RepID=UPI000EC489A6|nr:hypothetical protein [Streptomyces sp. YIM 130001]RII13817.1 hypothetical protein DSC45_22955 [Streptomyces sp. YIM 130001]
MSLDKGSRIATSLDKKDPELVVTATLEWDGGNDRRRKQGADLDLYALFVPAAEALRGPTAPGSLVKRHVPHGDPAVPGIAPRRDVRRPAKGEGSNAVYYRNLGSLQDAPFLRLDGDSLEPGVETVRISRPEEQGYVLFCAYSAVSNGFGSFRSFGAKVVVTDSRGSTVTVPLFENAKTRYWVAIALVDFTVPEGASIQHIEAYGGRMAESRPVLHADGTIELNAGPAEFKRPG